jgi:hypothetical protein
MKTKKQAVDLPRINELRTQLEDILKAVSKSASEADSEAWSRRTACEEETNMRTLIKHARCVHLSLSDLRNASQQLEDWLQETDREEN